MAATSRRRGRPRGRARHRRTARRSAPGSGRPGQPRGAPAGSARDGARRPASIRIAPTSRSCRRARRSTTIVCRARRGPGRVSVPSWPRPPREVAVTLHRQSRARVPPEPASTTAVSGFRDPDVSPGNGHRGSVPGALSGSFRPCPNLVEPGRERQGPVPGEPASAPRDASACARTIPRGSPRSVGRSTRGRVCRVAVPHLGRWSLRDEIGHGVEDRPGGDADAREVDRPTSRWRGWGWAWSSSDFPDCWVAVLEGGGHDRSRSRTDPQQVVGRRGGEDREGRRVEGDACLRGPPARRRALSSVDRPRTRDTRLWPGARRDSSAARAGPCQPCQLHRPKPLPSSREQRPTRSGSMNPPGACGPCVQP